MEYPSILISVQAKYHLFETIFRKNSQAHHVNEHTLFRRVGTIGATNGDIPENIITFSKSGKR